MLRVDTLHPPTYITFKDYVKTPPTWEQDLLLHTTEKPSTFPLHDLLTQKHPTLLATNMKTTAPSVRYLALTKKTSRNAKASHEVVLCNPTARKDGRLSLLSFLTHYILYLEIQTSDDLCITSYYDNHSLLKNEETFHTRDIDSSSWYTNSDHDVIITLSALRTKLPFRLASIHVRAHQNGHCEFNLLPRPAHLNVLADKLASEVLAGLRAAHQSTEFYPLPACRVYLRNVTGHTTSREKRTLTNEFPEYEIGSYLQQRNGWTAHILDSINWTAYREAISALICDQTQPLLVTIWHPGTPMWRCD
jgi:hypothetical protein